jgi:hypothetical protein
MIARFGPLAKARVIGFARRLAKSGRAGRAATGAQKNKGERAEATVPRGSLEQPAQAVGVVGARGGPCVC